MSQDFGMIKFRTLGACQKRPRQTVQSQVTCFQSSLIRVFLVCCSDKHFVNSSPENKHKYKIKTKILYAGFRYGPNARKPV